MPLNPLSLILGGAASGKSAFAETLVLGSGLRPVYLATAQVWDTEMREKVTLHQERRIGAGWRVVEEPHDVSATLENVTEEECVLLDCATFWLTNHILAQNDLQAAEASLFGAIDASKAPIVVVSNEVGAGIVPENALSRQFREAQGKLNQRLAERAGLVVAVMAGLPLTLKGQLP